MPETVRFVNNITKVYPDMIKFKIYREPMVLVKSDTVKRNRLMVDDHDFNPTYQSVNRTKTLIRDIILCNDFEFFVTFTFDPKKVDSFNYNACLGKISRWIHNQRENSPEMKYLIVPEQHKSGRWHFHAVISHFNGSMSLSRCKTDTGRDIYNLTCFRSGFTTAVPVDDKNAVSEYISKYITKDLISQFNRRRFIASKNLIRPQKYVNSPLFRLTPPLFLRKTGSDDCVDYYVSIPL